MGNIAPAIEKTKRMMKNTRIVLTICVPLLFHLKGPLHYITSNTDKLLIFP